VVQLSSPMLYQGGIFGVRRFERRFEDSANRMG
jgi:hypothetical protein